MKDIVNKFIDFMNSEQEKINFINAVVALRHENVKFSVGNKQTIIIFIPFNESIRLEFADFNFLKEFSYSLFETYQNEKTVPISQIKLLNYEELAFFIAKCIESHNGKYSYEYYCELLADCT